MIILSKDILGEKINNVINTIIVEYSNSLNMSTIDINKYLLEAKTPEEIILRFNELFINKVKIVK